MYAPPNHHFISPVALNPTQTMNVPSHQTIQLSQPSVPQPDLLATPPQPPQFPAVSWQLLSKDFQPLLEATSDKVNAFLLGIRMARTVDPATLTEFCDTLCRMRYLTQKLERSITELGPLVNSE